MNPNQLMQSWLDFWTEAAKGPQEAQAAYQKMMAAWPQDPAVLAQFFPGDFSQREAYRDWLEDAWRAMGVVPRGRYLELLEQVEGLRQRLAEAEKTIQRLQGMVAQERQAEVEKMVDSWQTAVSRTLQAQADWMRLWMPGDKDDMAASEDS